MTKQYFKTQFASGSDSSDLGVAAAKSTERGEAVVEYVIFSALFVLAAVVSLNGAAIATGKTFCASATAIQLAGGGSISSLNPVDSGIGFDDCFSLFGYIHTGAVTSHQTPPPVSGASGQNNSTSEPPLPLD